MSDVDAIDSIGTCELLLACGGDGTVGWVLTALDTSQMQYMDFVSVGVIPLGTGNDMARFLGWGVGYHGESLASVIQSLAKSESRLLDRWQIDVKPTAHTGVASLKVSSHSLTQRPQTSSSLFLFSDSTTSFQQLSQFRCRCAGSTSCQNECLQRWSVPLSLWLF